MKTITMLSVAAIALGLAACENPTATNAARIANSQAEASGSPFRWKTQSVSGGTTMMLVMADLPSGPTRADPVLKKDILALITKAEAAEGRKKGSRLVSCQAASEKAGESDKSAWRHDACVVRSPGARRQLPAQPVS